MKQKIISFIVIALFYSSQTFSQETLHVMGNAIQLHVSISDLAAPIMSPFIGLSMDCASNGDDRRVLLYFLIRSNKGYTEFPFESRLLVKLQDDEIIELYGLGDYAKDYKCVTWKKELVDVYSSSKSFRITDEILPKMLSKTIIKFRVELVNGDFYDFELSKSRGKRIQKLLYEEYQTLSAQLDGKIRRKNSDIKTGF